MGFSVSSEALWSVVWAAAAVAAVAWGWRAAVWLWLRPRRLERALRAQGLRGTPYRLLNSDLREETRLQMESLSNPIAPFSHCIAPRVSPFFHLAMNQYGKISFTWSGPNPRVAIMDPELIREILLNKFSHFEKPEIGPLGTLLAKGVAGQKGEKWVQHRRIINPAFHLEKLKLMLPAFSTCCEELINKWDELVGSKGSCELDVWPELQSFTADVISRTAFGSSYREGRRIFQLQAEQAKLLVDALQFVHIPGYRFFPTRKSYRRREIYKEVRAIILSMIEQRERDVRNGEGINDDLLGLLMESNSRHMEEDGDSMSFGLTTDEVIDECKLFYFAGHETSSVLLTWTMILLSMHPDWQMRAREEVVLIFGGNKPNFDGLNRLKVVSMILNEVLRLYPPGIFIFRRTYKEMKLGKFTLPPGVQLLLHVLAIHHDPEIWGEDAGEFKPDRFAEGISKASKIQGAFFPFGLGPRICVGQSFALLEAKMALAMILQHFSFELSPSYIHAPHVALILQPQHGAQIIVHKL